MPVAAVPRAPRIFATALPQGAAPFQSGRSCVQLSTQLEIFRAPFAVAQDTSRSLFVAMLAAIGYCGLAIAEPPVHVSAVRHQLDDSFDAVVLMATSSGRGTPTPKMSRAIHSPLARPG